MAAHNELGEWGEEKAAEYLIKKGFYIRHRDWKSGHRDIDLVAIDEDSTILLFVEVKTRQTDFYGSPDEAVDREKRKNLLAAAHEYILAYHMGWIEQRFDIISVVGTNDDNVKITHIEDAFGILL